MEARASARYVRVTPMKARRVVDQHCIGCHSETPTVPAFPIAPGGVVFDSAALQMAAGLFAKAPALGALGLLGLGPGALVGVALGGAALWGYGKLYRHSLGKLHEELHRLVGTIDVTARTGNAFAPPAAPRPSPEDGAAAMIVLTSI